MPVHDWSKAGPGTWHDFHLGWSVGLQQILNQSLLPAAYYAQIQYAEGREPDPISIDEASQLPQIESRLYAQRRRSISIHLDVDDSVVAQVLFVSPGNKQDHSNARMLAQQCAQSLDEGIHLTIIDLFPPTTFDAHNVPALIWSEATKQSITNDSPLSISSFDASQIIQVYYEPTAVGKALPDMPLFLEPAWYITLPLEATYTAAFRGVPRKWQKVLE